MFSIRCPFIISIIAHFTSCIFNNKKIRKKVIIKLLGLGMQRVNDV